MSTPKGISFKNPCPQTQTDTSPDRSGPLKTTKVVGNYRYSNVLRDQASTRVTVAYHVSSLNPCSGRSRSQLEHSTSSTMTQSVIVARKNKTLRQRRRDDGELLGLLATSTTLRGRRSGVHRLFRRRSNPSPSSRSTLRRKYSSWRGRTGRRQ